MILTIIVIVAIIVPRRMTIVVAMVIIVTLDVVVLTVVMEIITVTVLVLSVLIIISVITPFHCSHLQHSTCTMDSVTVHHNKSSKSTIVAINRYFRMLNKIQSLYE